MNLMVTHTGLHTAKARKDDTLVPALLLYLFWIFNPFITIALRLIGKISLPKAVAQSCQPNEGRVRRSLNQIQHGFQGFNPVISSGFT